MDNRIFEDIRKDIREMTDEEMIQEMAEVGCPLINKSRLKSFREIEEFLINNEDEANLVYRMESTSKVAKDLRAAYEQAIVYNDIVAAHKFEALWQDWLIERKNYE